MSYVQNVFGSSPSVVAPNTQREGQQDEREGAIPSVPNEVWLHIFSFLSAKDLSNSQQVCRQWKLWSDDTGLWRRLLHKTFPYLSRLVGSSENDCEAPFKGILGAQANLKALKVIQTSSLDCPHFSQDSTFSWDGRRIATLDHSRGDPSRRRFEQLCIWDVEKKECLLSIKPVDELGGPMRIRDFAFSPDGQSIAVTFWFHTARLYSLETGKCLSILKTFIDERGSYPGSLSFSPNGQSIVTVFPTGEASATPIVWDAKTGEPLHILKGHTQLIAKAVFSPDSQKIATASSDSTVRVWDAKTGQCLHTFGGEDFGLCYSDPAFSSSSQWLVTSVDSADSVQIWDVNTGKCLKRIVPLPEMGRVSHIAIAPTDQFIAFGTQRGQTGGQGASVHIWDIQSEGWLGRLNYDDGRAEPNVWRWEDTEIWKIAFSPCGRKLLVNDTLLDFSPLKVARM
ncbi:F-box/WD40 repeat-containing protein [Parachlamydia sp. AcF125]|uniref:F-box/WD repeat-containing protein n=1 Tax=Parachlamydia sp. AcF125 TaxID=2795736 RepID=UPI001BCA2218|nr:F-box/WD40 repeat-containing protein [Parachlamydia sp. AcF125]MBS4168951.1 hypothetical protein [Parachlamydia sp. AcF125]